MSGLEVLGAAASAIQFADAAWKISKLFSSLSSHVKDTPSSVLKRKAQIEHLAEIARVIKNSLVLQTDLIASLLRACVQEIGELEGLLSKLVDGATSGRITRYWKAIGGIQTEKRISAICERLEREKTAIILCIVSIDANTTSKIGEDVGQVIQDLPSLQETAKGVSVLLDEVKDVKLMTATLRDDLANLVQSLRTLSSTIEPSESSLSSHGGLSSGDPTVIKANLEALQNSLHNLTKFNRCIASLTVAEQVRIIENNVNQSPQSCQWFLHDPRFEGWKNSPNAQLMYLSARAGCGKTTIASHVVHNLITMSANSGKDSNGMGSTDTGSDLQKPVFFFFSKNGRERENTVVVALCTMIDQLCRRYPLLSRFLEEYYDSNVTKGTIVWSAELLLQLFIDMLRGIKNERPLYIVIDAIDECQDGSGEDLVCSLNSVAQEQGGSEHCAGITKILVTGRREEGIIDLIEPSQHFEMTKEQTEKDIEGLIEEGVEKLAARRSLNSGVRNVISNFLKENSAGMFLWVNLVLKELGTRDRPFTDETIALKLSSVPVTLGDVYESIIRETPPASISSFWRVIRWLLYSKGQLHVTQLRALLCLELGSSTWHGFRRDVEYFCRSFVRFETELLPSTYKSSAGNAHQPVPIYSAPGARIDVESVSAEPQNESCYVQLIHQTARDFLHPYVKRISMEETGGIEMKAQQAETHLATICIRLLQPDLLQKRFGDLTGSDFSRIFTSLDSHPEVCYAADHWAKHLASAGTPSASLLSLTKQLLKTQGARNLLMKFAYFFKHGRCTGIPKGSPLHLACYFNLPWLVQDYLKVEKEHPNTLADASDTPLIWASEMGAIQCAEALLEAGADPNRREYDGWSALHWTATNRHTDLCELLLKHGADPSVKDTRGSKPLDWAVERGCEDIVRLLSGELAFRNTPRRVKGSRRGKVWQKSAS
ncbi:MAG: hypothetical protein Q9191_003834 [Dirinaria sp. TL-2023a]